MLILVLDLVLCNRCFTLYSNTSVLSMERVHSRESVRQSLGDVYDLPALVELDDVAKQHTKSN
jgi:hypothetical protein